MPVTTSVPDAQKKFDEGMLFRFGFDSDAAGASFGECSKADNDCAMCLFGAAYAAGPFLNHPVLANQSVSAAQQLAAKAKALAMTHSVTKKESLLIAAMAERYSLTNQTAGYVAYAEALKEAMTTLQGDADVSVLYAEALMVLSCSPEGYNFYDKHDRPVPNIAEAIRVLEGLILEPDTRKLKPTWVHPLALHLYIHATEPSRAGYGKDSAGRAAGAADRLRKVFNATTTGSLSQHLQHMSSHVYLRVGRYNDAITVNMEAHRSDMALLRGGVVPYGAGHDTAFLICAANLDGQLDTAERYGVVLRSIYSAAPTRPDGPGPEQGWNIPLTTWLRFGEWSPVLSDNATLPPAAGDLPYAATLRSFAKGVASARVGDETAAMEYLEMLEKSMARVSTRYAGMASVANLTLRAVIAATSGHDDAMSLIQRATEEQDAWSYNEPPDWFMPLRQCLAQQQLVQGRFADADATFRADLNQYLDNAWSLHGLVDAMRKQPTRYTPEQIAEVRDKAEAAWARATKPFVAPCPILPLSPK
eukprot:CAMPEP_0175859354 /NCGR_PEP_ID=MMETSP0107_2-20121207/30210_1 /TAXON_ID=195067 ORGANISM="Goniomonas pacifica, Strain CCMP1869" /NCGR_SAMPLE_ID=MMETSP0107_2 /ASSEMBLY_ACC=CAM_ASM_000203 /LENGTH=530 /DNA_ID=CAMNT_0017175967 /DNA_START=120 /DNA_END=1709 /DNA_ORIENTATION=-